MARILIIEDDEEICAKMLAVLEQAGHDVFVASDDADGTHQFEAMVGGSEAPDVIIVDMLVPEKGGYLLIGEFRETLPDVKIISVVEDVGGRQLILEISDFLGADRTLSQPIQSQDLLDTVGACLA